MALFTEGDIENYTAIDIDSSFSTWITFLIAAVTEYVEKYCGIDFENTASAEKYYDGPGTNELLIDEAQSLSALVIYDIDGNQIHSLTENDDYYLYPLNDDIKNRIVLTRTGKITNFPSWNRSIKATGVFGHASVPTPVKLVAIKIAAKFLEKAVKGGEADSEKLGDYTIDYKEIDEQVETLGIKEILNQYRAVRLE